MSYSIINLTAKVVNQELDNILVNYSQHPCLLFLSLPFIRQKILVNVLNCLPNRYALVENQQEKEIFNNVQQGVLKEKLLIEYLINKNILELSILRTAYLVEKKILSQIIYQPIEKDSKNIFKQQYLNNRSEVNFRVLALARMSGKSWQKISLQLGVPITELKNFYQRCCQMLTNK